MSKENEKVMEIVTFEKEPNGKEIKLRPIVKSIGWVISILVIFLLYESMAMEFLYFDEFTIFFVLFFIALELTRFRILYEKKLE